MRSLNEIIGANAKAVEELVPVPSNEELRRQGILAERERVMDILQGEYQQTARSLDERTLHWIAALVRSGDKPAPLPRKDPKVIFIKEAVEEVLDERIPQWEVQYQTHSGEWKVTEAIQEGDTERVEFLREFYAGHATRMPYRIVQNY